MKQGHVLTTDEVDDIVAAYRGGLTMDQVARQLGHGLSSVNKYLRERGIERRPKGHRKQRLLASCLEIRSRYEAGEPAHIIARDYGASKPTIFKVLRAQGATIRDNSECQVKHVCDHRYFQTIDTERKAYWLGFFTADGSIRPPNIIALGLKMTDGDHVRRFAEHIYTSCPVEDRPDREWPMTEIAFRSTRMTADFAAFGVVPNKEQTVPWPSLADDLVRHYLRGVIDGDGSFPEPEHVPTRNQISIQIASGRDYAEACQQFLMATFGFGKTKISRRGKKRGIYVLCYSGNQQLFPFFNWLYEDATIFLPRKRQIVLDHYRALPKYRDQLRFG